MGRKKKTGKEARMEEKPKEDEISMEDEKVDDQGEPILSSSVEPEPKSEFESEPKSQLEHKSEPESEPETTLPSPPEEVQSLQPVVPLEVFLKVAGPKWDQLAGFKFYAKKSLLGPMTVQDWRVALQQFMKRPTR